MSVRILRMQAKGLLAPLALAMLVFTPGAVIGGQTHACSGIGQAGADLRSGRKAGRTASRADHEAARVTAKLLTVIFGCDKGQTRLAPRMRVDADALAFGAADLNVGLGSAQIVPITNVGTMPLVVSSVSFSGVDLLEFTHGAALPLVIRAGGTAEINVWFDPSSPGRKSAALNIMGNDPDMPLAQVALSGTGIINEFASLRIGPAYGE